MSIWARQGIQVNYPVTIPKEIRPVDGYWASDPPQEIPFGASRDMLNCQVFQGALRKRPGYSEYGGPQDSIGGPVLGLFSTQDTENNTHLVALHNTGGAKWNTGTDSWDPLTGPALTGGVSTLFQFENSQNSIVFSQGVDQVMLLPLTGLVYAVLDASCPPAKYMTRFAGRLNLGYTSESGNSKPFRHRRPVRSDHTDWTGVGSGFRDAEDFPYHMRNLRKLGTQMAIYYENAIELVTQVPNAAAPFKYDTKAPDSGLYGPYTLKGRNVEHFYLGNDDFYAFNGVQVRSIGWKIRDDVYAVLNATQLHRMFGETLVDSQEYLAFICTGASVTPDTVWVYNFGRDVWYPWSVSGPLCSTIHRLDDTITIDELQGTIDEQNWEFDTRVLQQAYPAMLTGHEDGKIYQWSPFFTADNGAPIACRWSSRDFRSEDIAPELGGHRIGIRALHFEYLDTGADFTLTFSFSTDGGQTYTQTETVVCRGGTGGWKTQTVHRILIGDKIRWKMEHNSATETFIISTFIPMFEIQEQMVSR